MKFHQFCPPYENPWLHLENSIIAPPLAHNVWLIMEKCWTTLLWSGSTKLCNRLCKHFRWFALKYFLWLRHQKLDWPENFWCNFRNWGAIAPLATRLDIAALNDHPKRKPETFFKKYMKSASTKGVITRLLAKSKQMVRLEPLNTRSAGIDTRLRSPCY